MQPEAQNKSSVERRAYTVREWCKAFGPSRATAYKMMAEGTLHTVKIGGRRLIPVDEAEQLLKAGARASDDR